MQIVRREEGVKYVGTTLDSKGDVEQMAGKATTALMVCARAVRKS